MNRYCQPSHDLGTKFDCFLQTLSQKRLTRPFSELFALDSQLLQWLVHPKNNLKHSHKHMFKFTGMAARRSSLAVLD